MSCRSAKFLCAVASAAAMTAFAAPAEAQRVNRIVAFGDSYADDGNFFELTGIPLPAPYPTGRFSGGTNFIDTMARLLSVPVDNFAIGGAFTGPGNTGFTNINGPGIPGFPTEVASYLGGGGPAAFPRVSGTFTPTDLVAVSIGGNDARYYQFNGGTVAGAPAAAAISVAEATAGLNALVNAGARNITFLAGDVGRLPEVRGNPISAVGSAFANSFNSGIRSSLANIAAQGVIVNYLDLNLIADRVEANLAAFGLTSAGACPVECVVNPGLQSQYLFYVDQVHLTSRGFEIVGQYAVRQLEAPLYLESHPATGLQAADGFGQTLMGRMDLSALRTGLPLGGANFYVAGNVVSADRPMTMTSDPYELDTFGITIGGEMPLGPNALAGVAVNYSRPQAKFRAQAATEAKAWQIAAYAGWTGGGAYAQGYAGYGWVDYDMERPAVIDRIDASADGNSVIAGAKAGFNLLGGAGIEMGPFAALRYARADVGGYTEAGDPVLTLDVEEQEVKSLIGSIGVETRGTYDMGGLPIRPYLSLAAEKELKGDGRTVRYSGTASPEIVNSWVVPGESKELYGRFNAGIDFSLGGSSALQLQGGSTFGREGGNDVSGFLSLKMGF